MARNFKKNQFLFIVWKSYQRRAEVLAPLFDAEVVYIPHFFRSKYLRPADYLYKFIVTIAHLLRKRPDFAIVQAPPHFAALPPLVLGTKYVIDGHNGVFQSYWHKLPLFNWVMKKATTIIVHNHEFRQLFQRQYPDKPFIVVADALESIAVPGIKRKRNQILFICSFDRDEPIDVIIDTIEQVPEYEFVITADHKKLPVTQRRRLEACRNLTLTGFLSVEKYHETLCSSTAAIALTSMQATQQSGACEALSSNTPLIATRSTLSETLFGEWAILVENTAGSIAAGIRALDKRDLELSAQVEAWNDAVHNGVAQVKATTLGTPAPEPKQAQETS